MAFETELQILNDYLRLKNLKHSSQREDILNIFLATEEHVSAEDLMSLVRQQYPHIGSATVYRTLKLMCKCGLAREVLPVAHQRPVIAVRKDNKKDIESLADLLRDEIEKLYPADQSNSHQAYRICFSVMPAEEQEKIRAEKEKGLK